MKMNKKGFTLIELLAVIVILAIIALIATPIILGIINDARKSANERSAELIETGVEYAITTYAYKHNGNLATTVEEIQEYFDVKNYEMDSTGKVTEKGKTEEFCALTDDAKGTFTLTCADVNGYKDGKVIVASESE